MNQEIINYLRSQAEARKAKALLTLRGFSQKFAAIGDHTTGDLYSNLDEAYQTYLDANDQIEGLTQLEKDLN